MNTELPKATETEELQEIRKKEQKLIKRFKKEAKVLNYEEGYVSVPFVNQQIDPQLQGDAADIIAHHIKSKELKIDKIVQIPYSGNSLATVVSERVGLPLVLGRKGDRTPGSWKQPVIIEEIQSFTTQAVQKMFFNSLEAGDSVYLVDDVVALGNTAPPIINGLRDKGIKVVGMAVYFAKLFQPGMQKIQDETGIIPFAVIGMEDFSEEGEIIYSEPQF